MGQGCDRRLLIDWVHTVSGSLGPTEVGVILSLGRSGPGRHQMLLLEGLLESSSLTHPHSTARGGRTPTSSSWRNSGWRSRVTFLGGTTEQLAGEGEGQRCPQNTGILWSLPVLVTGGIEDELYSSSWFILCQLAWATRCPDPRVNEASSMSVTVFSCD